MTKEKILFESLSKNENKRTMVTAVQSMRLALQQASSTMACSKALVDEDGTLVVVAYALVVFGLPWMDRNPW